MMIIGAKFWNDRSRYYAQTNNPTETLLRIDEAREGGTHGWLETCGPTSAVNCLAAMDRLPIVQMPGGYVPQPEELLEDYFTDPRNFPDFLRFQPGALLDHVPANEYPALYPLAVARVFGEGCRFIDRELAVAEAIEQWNAGRAIQVCLINPGHFIAAVAFDMDKQEIIYNDPWPGRVGGDGFNRRLTAEGWIHALKDYAICYGEV